MVVLKRIAMESEQRCEEVVPEDYIRPPPVATGLPCIVGSRLPLLFKERNATYPTRPYGSLCCSR